MPRYATVLIFGALAVVAAWRIQRDLLTGVSGDGRARYALGQNPFGYLLMIVSKVLVLVLCAAEVLHALGMVGDPVAAIQTAFPFLPRRH